VDRDRIKGVGVASAGIVDSKTNRIIYASNLGARDVKVGDFIRETFRFPVKMVNDANAAALAEWKWGAGGGNADLVYITVSN
jgi:glucokinase